jgi:AraC family transcriptional regulator, transcriptional activator of the genes for pyochelin and ferripyochelin receptors
MTDKFELDVSDMISATKSARAITGVDALGPRERIMCSVNHVYRRLESGLFLHIQNFRVAQTYDYRVVRRGYLTFQFLISGRFRLDSGVGLHQYNAGTVRISNFARSESKIEADGKHILGLHVFVERAYLIDHFGLDVNALPESLRPLFCSTLDFPTPLELALSTSAWISIEQILYCQLPEPLRGIFLNAKATELICDIVACLNELRPFERVFGVSRETRETQMIETAAAIYRREMKSSPSIAEMSRRVGLNKNSLSEGFRERFGVTPGEYSRAVRLDWARKRLAEGSMPVAAIAAAAGYDSHAAFTRSFSERFGHSPSATKPDSIP